jgi:hypothetical protein
MKPYVYQPIETREKLETTIILAQRQQNVNEQMAQAFSQAVEKSAKK